MGARLTINISPTAFVSEKADIEDSVRGSKITFGENSYIDSFVKIKAAGGSGDIEIGRNVQINSCCVLYIGNGIEIGDDSMVAAGVVFAPTNHEYLDDSKPIREQGFKKSKGGIHIGRDCWIGAGSVLLDGTWIGDGAVVGAMSLINGRIEPYSIGFGNPYRLTGYRNRVNLAQ